MQTVEKRLLKYLILWEIIDSLHVSMFYLITNNLSVDYETHLRILLFFTSQTLQHRYIHQADMQFNFFTYNTEILFRLI